MASTNSKPPPGGQGLNLQHHVAVLAAAARLLDELAFNFVAGLADGFTVGHLRLADVGFNAELALHAVDQNFQVQFAHAGNDGLAGFFVAAHAERRIFLSQTRQRQTHLFLVSLRLGFHGLRNHGLRENHAFEQDVGVDVAQRFAGGHVFQTHHGGDVACQHFLDFFAVVRVHLQNAADTFLLALDGVVDRIARLQDARVNAHEGQLTHERIAHQLECQRRELLFVVGFARDRIAIVVLAVNRGNVHGRNPVRSVGHRDARTHGVPGIGDLAGC